MAFENFPESEKPYQEIVMPPNNSRGNLRGILTVTLVVALLGTWGYIIWDKNNVKETIQQKDSVIASTTNQRDELQKDLEDATMRYDSHHALAACSANYMDLALYRNLHDCS